MAWTVILAWPALVVIAAGLWHRPSRRLAMGQALPLAALVGMWLLLSNATNFSGRFQFAGAMVALAGTVVVYPHLPESVTTPTAAAVRGHALVAGGVATVLLVGVAGQMVRAAPQLVVPKPSMWSAVGKSLAPFAGPGRRMVTTEAGLIPLRSGCRAVDAYGLNDPQIGHADGITRARFDSAHPDVVVMHELHSSVPRWREMIERLSGLVDGGGYQLAFPADPASKGFGDNWRIYVRADAPDRDALVTAIAQAAAEVRRAGGADETSQ